MESENVTIGLSLIHIYVDLSQIQVVVHPQSVIHSAVEYADGAVIAQLGTPDMRIPDVYKRQHLHRA